MEKYFRSNILVQNIPNKNKCKSIKFDSIELYTSITESLLKNSINFTKEYVNIDFGTINLIMHCRKSVLFGDGSTWTNKNGSLFDVTMGSYDETKICKLVGLYLFHKIDKNIKNQHLGLYSENGLAIINSKSGLIIKRIKKTYRPFFKTTAESNLLETDFLNITLNLITGKYCFILMQTRISLPI